MIDLHIHSTMSDGQYSPKELVSLAVQKNISVMALTDHDTVSGISEGQGAAEDAGITFVSGIEISVKGNRELHILGYCVDVNNAELIKICDWFVEQRVIRERKILEYLNAKGIPLIEDDIEKHTNCVIGRPHFARAMVEKGYVSNFREAFDRYLATPEFEKIERPKPSPQEGISVIVNAGGVAVLAHPSQLKLDSNGLENLVKELVDCGLCGIECYYSTHTPSQTKEYLSLADKYGLVVTGGSDFHGEKVKSNIELGTGIDGSLCFDDNDIVEKLLKCRRTL